MMGPTDATNDRLIRVESALMHIEHDLGQMHQAILAQQREIDAIRRILERFETAIEREAQLSSEVRDPASEKPPHY